MKYQEIIRQIKNADSVAVFCHTNPDGDTLGSAVALHLAVRKMGKDSTLVCDSAVPHKYRMLTCCGVFVCAPKTDTDLFIAVDCANLTRLGENAAVFSKHKNTANIDHHHDNDKFADVNVLRCCAGTAEIVLDIIDALDVSLDKDMAAALYVGLATDTGSFQHGSTTESTFLAAAKLASCGIDIEKISFEMFKLSPLNRTKLLGRVLSRIRTYQDGKVTAIYTLTADFEEFKLDRSATESFVDYAIGVEGAVVGVAFSQHSENVYKVSMRSRGASDVSAICKDFGGGGHKQAAGCIVSGFFEDVVEKVVRQIGFYL
jgi:phosphoesterase RecJ-like protein